MKFFFYYHHRITNYINFTIS